jgi:hypothetical protein
VVTAACADSVAGVGAVGEGSFIDFAHLTRQLPIARVLDQLGLSERLCGRGPQRRCACPLHRGGARGRTFSVNLGEHVFPCFDKLCGRKGDFIDLGAAAHGLALREAALDLVRTFNLEPAPCIGTEKRNGYSRLRYSQSQHHRARGRPRCAPRTPAEPFLPPVLTAPRPGRIKK